MYETLFQNVNKNFIINIIINKVTRHIEIEKWIPL